jgi:hypothetical protein
MPSDSITGSMSCLIFSRYVTELSAIYFQFIGSVATCSSLVWPASFLTQAPLQMVPLNQPFKKKKVGISPLITNVLDDFQAISNI